MARPSSTKISPGRLPGDIIARAITRTSTSHGFLAGGDIDDFEGVDALRNGAHPPNFTAVWRALRAPGVNF